MNIISDKTIHNMLCATCFTLSLSIMPIVVSAADDDDDIDDDAAAAAFVHSTGFSAIDAAIAGEAQTGGLTLTVELESEDSRWVYEVDTALADGTFYEVLYDASTGELLSSKIDTDNDDDASDIDAAISSLSPRQTRSVIRTARARCRIYSTGRKKRQCRRRHGLQ